MDQRRAEGEPGLRLELARVAGLRPGRRACERANAGVEAARADRRAAGLQARARGVLSAGGDGGRRSRLRGAKQGGAGIPAVFGTKQFHAGRDLPVRRRAITGLGVAPHE
jgi:hypothetical protein